MVIGKVEVWQAVSGGSDYVKLPLSGFRVNTDTTRSKLYSQVAVIGNSETQYGVYSEVSCYYFYK